MIAAIGAKEVPTMAHSWILLRDIGVLDLRKEFEFLALVVGGAVVGWLGATVVLQLFPHL